MAAVDVPMPVKVEEEVTFRDFDNSKFQNRVEKLYKAMHENQSMESVQALWASYRQLNKASMGIEPMMAFLDTVIDESDPDNDLPQTIHAFQTAESVVRKYFSARDQLTTLRSTPVRQLFNAGEWTGLPTSVREMYEGKTLCQLFPHITDWSWFPLAALIHDLGKVIAHEDFGGLPQYAVVGDTFITGCAFDAANVFAEKGWWSANADASHPVYSTKEGAYEPHCGLRNVVHSFGHDEYMAMVLEGYQADAKSGRVAPLKAFPQEAIDMIRFHSFYTWHTPRAGTRGYLHLVADEDWQLLPLVKALQKSDLYSKSPDIPPVDELKAYYGKLIATYFPGDVRW